MWGLARDVHYQLNFNDFFQFKPAMKLTLGLLSFSCLVSLKVLAQENYQNGYVVTTGGDTLRGRIDQQQWVANPGRIVFMAGAGGQRVVYTVSQLSAFAVQNEAYRSYTVTLYPYSQDPAVVTAGNWSGKSYDTTVFLRLITTGRLTLWGYRDATDVIYFLLQTGKQAPVQLRIQNRVIVHGAASNVVTDDVYKYQLADYVAACSKIADRPVPVAYEENALKKLIDTYNQCGVGSEGGGKRRRVTVNLLVFGGYLHSAVKPGGNTDATYAHWPAFSGPTGGLGVWIQPATGSKNRKRWGLVIDALYDDLSVNSGRFQKNYYQVYTGKLAYMEVKGNIQLRYAYPLGDFRPFLGIGFSNSLTFNNTSSQKYTDASNSTVIRQPLFGSGVDLARYRPGAFGVVGLAWKRWSLEGRYERTADLVNTTTGIKVPVTNLYALAAFAF
jgi:hypothetical protein